MAGTVLVVDDEPAIREMIGFTLSQAGLSCADAGDAHEAEAEILRDLPDLIVLDWMLPGQSGIDFARRLRRDEATRSIPIIMVTARGEEEDKVRGLNIGADDYVTKPFAPRELVARVEAVLRRTRTDAVDDILQVGGLILDPKIHRVYVTDQALKLALIEFRLLHVLMAHPDRVYSRAQLLDLVWGRNLHVGERTVDMHVSNLRKATELSLEEQQKLCIARLLPVKPTVLLMDEPCSALDPKGTEAVEELIWGLSEAFTIVIVTHNMAQARRASEECIFMLMGKVIEHAETADIFVTPANKETADYIEGRYG